MTDLNGHAGKPSANAPGALSIDPWLDLALTQRLRG